jgi:hypothetical protein
MKPSLLYFLTLSASTLIGWWLGHLARPQPSSAAAQKEVEPTQTKAQQQLPDMAQLGRPQKDGALLDRWNFAHVVQQTSIEELGNLLKKARANTDPTERRERELMVAARYAQLDPEKTAADAFQHDRALALLVMPAWAAQDGRAAAEWMGQHGDLANRMEGMPLVLASFAHANPEDCFEFMVGDGSRSRGYQEGFTNLFASLTKRSPARAIELLSRVTNPVSRLEGYASVAKTWAKQDPKAALAWAKGLGDQHERANALQAATSVVAESDPHTAIQALNMIDPAGKPTGETPHRAIAKGLAKLNFDEAVQWVKQLDPLKHNQEVLLTQSVLPALKNITATALVDMYKGVDVAGRSSDFSETVNVPLGLLPALLRWQVKDVSAALKEVSVLPNGEGRDCVLNFLCWKMSQESPTAALQFAAQADAGTREKLAGHLARTLATEGKVAELAQAIKLNPAEGSATVAARDAAALLAKNYPERGAEFLQQLSEDLRPVAAAKMVPDLVARDPATAIALAQNLPAEAQAQQMGVVAAEWAKVNSTDSMRWAQTLPAGPQRDTAAANLAATLVQKEPHNAFTWAHQISDADQRAPQLQSVLNEWLFQDAAAAKQAIAMAQIPPDELAKALQPIDDGHPNPGGRNRDRDYVPVGEPDLPPPAK